MATDWSQLPKELLELITKRLNTSIDILRFRSVCSSWRSSLSYSPRRLPGRFPIFPDDQAGNSSEPRPRGFYLSKRTIFRLGLPESRRPSSSIDSSGGCWMIKVEEDIPGNMHLLNPLSKTLIKPLPTVFPKVLDLLNFRIYEVGQEYVLQYTECRRPFFNYVRDAGNLYMEKVAFSSNGSDEYVLITIHVSGKLAMFRSENKSWTIIQDLPSPYDDVINFKGQFYAVDNTGRTVVVDNSPAVTTIALPVFGGDKKCLVELEGELLLVDIYLTIGPEENPCYFCESGDNDEDISFGNYGIPYLVERTVRYKVFMLDVDPCGLKKWVEMKSLGDHVLFLGDNCSFSALASDFSGCKRNSIYFTDSFYRHNSEEDGSFMLNDIGVFNLGDGSIGPLECYPGYTQIFWPPPAWVTSTMLEQRRAPQERMAIERT